MCTLVTKPAPDFTANAVYPDFSIKPLTLSSYKGKYVILFFYPLDFSFLCPTELIAFNRQLDEFKKRNCEVISVSVDSEFTHFNWKSLEPKQGGVGDVQFPLVSDLTKNIARDYGVLVNDAVALRGLFLIDKEGIVRHCVINDLPLARDVNEALRILDALQFLEKYGELCPANWHPGEDGVKPTQDGIKNYLANH